MGACHGNLNGKGGFRLSLRGDDPAFDLLALTHDTFGRRTDRNDPARSLIVLKPTGRMPHEGGQRFPPGSAEEAALLGWIASGAGDDVATAPRLSRLVVAPAERIVAAPGCTQQLVVTAEFSDGTRRDVTRQASYDVSDPTRASVTVDGRVEVGGPCETTVAVRYLGGRGISRLAFLADRPDFAWRGPEPKNAIDRHVFAKLKALKINPSEPSGDSAFLRRAYLDALGRLPDPREARAFLADPDPDKRDRLVDRLVAAPEFADFWALKWADLLRNEEKTMGPKGVWVFQRWLRDQVGRDVPLDEFARQLVTAQGSTWTNPPVQLPPHQPRPDDRRRGDRPGLPRRAAPVRPLPQPPVRRLDAGRLLRPGRLLRQRPAQGDQQLPPRRPRHARDQRRRDGLPLGPPRAGPAPLGRDDGAEAPPRPQAPAGRRPRRARRPRLVADPRQPPVRPQPGQPRLVQPDRAAASSTPSTTSATRTPRATPRCSTR